MRKLGNRGFALVEMLVGTGVLGLIAALVSTGVYQSITATQKANASFQTQGAVRVASLWINKDLPMVQATDLVDGAAPVNAAAFTWTDYFSGVQLTHSLSYALAGNDLTRTYDGVTHTIGRGIGGVSFSRSGKLITAALVSGPQGRYAIADQATIKSYMRST